MRAIPIFLVAALAAVAFSREHDGRKHKHKAPGHNVKFEGHSNSDFGAYRGGHDGDDEEYDVFEHGANAPGKHHHKGPSNGDGNGGYGFGGLKNFWGGLRARSDDVDGSYVDPVDYSGDIDEEDDDGDDDETDETEEEFSEDDESAEDNDFEDDDNTLEARDAKKNKHKHRKHKHHKHKNHKHRHHKHKPQQPPCDRSDPADRILCALGSPFCPKNCRRGLESFRTSEGDDFEDEPVSVDKRDTSDADVDEADFFDDYGYYDEEDDDEEDADEDYDEGEDGDGDEDEDEIDEESEGILPRSRPNFEQWYGNNKNGHAPTAHKTPEPKHEPKHTKGGWKFW